MTEGAPLNVLLPRWSGSGTENSDNQIHLGTLIPQLRNDAFFNICCTPIEDDTILSSLLRSEVFSIQSDILPGN